MTRTPAVPSADGKPSPRKGSSRTPAWKIGPVGEEQARICIRAAELRARAVSYRDIQRNSASTRHWRRRNARRPATAWPRARTSAWPAAAPPTNST